MKSIALVAVITVVVAGAMAMASQNAHRMSAGAPSDAVVTYEHLATAIIAIRETEDSLVHGILLDYLDSARTHLDEAAIASGKQRRKMLEAAATEITNLANEGDKRIQAVRQRLLKAGHHHNTDTDTQEDFMFIDSREKAALLAFAGEVAHMRSASSDDIRAATGRFTSLAERAVLPE